MGRRLFALEDNFIDSMCMGSSDHDVLEEVAQALEAGRLELEDSVQRSIGRTEWSEHKDEFHVVLQGGAYVVTAPAEVEADVLNSEYGDLDTRPRPVIRQAVQQARAGAQMAITKKLGLR